MGLVQSIASSINPREDRNVALATLVELDPVTDKVDPTTIRSFQYYPETLSTSRSVEYVEKRILGGSHPIYQWMTCNATPLSFDVVFSRDTQPPLPPPSPQNAPGGFSGALQAAQGLTAAVSNVVKNPISAAISLAKGTSTNDDSRYNVDIPAAVAWIKSKTYPTYGSTSKLNPNTRSGLANPPPKLLLYLPNSGIISGVSSSQTINPIPDSMYCLLTEANITYEAFFRSGAPRVVVMSLSFVETIQIGSAWGFVDRKKVLSNWESRYTLVDPKAKVLGGTVNGTANISSNSNVVQIPGT